VHYRRPAAGHIQLSIDAGSEPSLVFVSEAHHPWWRVSVDGVSAQLLRAQMAFLAVRVGPGQHTIEMRLEPPLVIAVADRLTAVSWLALSLAVSGWSFVRIRRRLRGA
jgi:hypothetical protein